MSKADAQSRDFIRHTEFARLVGVSAKTIRRQARAGTFPGAVEHSPRRLLVPRSYVELVKELGLRCLRARARAGFISSPVRDIVTPSPPRWVSHIEMARVLGVSPRCIRRAVKLGGLPGALEHSARVLMIPGHHIRPAMDQGLNRLVAADFLRRTSGAARSHHVPGRLPHPRDVALAAGRRRKNDFITPGRLAEPLGVSPRFIRLMVTRGKLPAVVVGPRARKMIPRYVLNLGLTFGLRTVEKLTAAGIVAPDYDPEFWWRWTDPAWRKAGFPSGLARE